MARIPGTESEDRPAIIRRGPVRERFIDNDHGYTSLTDVISEVVLTSRPPLVWFTVFGISFVFLNFFLFAVVWLLFKGTGVWGNNQPTGWAWDIINFVWWIGIGHAGTLISAILLIFQQQWRNSINRFAEAMTIFAVVCAGMYPLLHTGRPWCDYWLFPYPNVLGMWPQFRSPLEWDVFAVSTYFTVSLLFWFLGLVPDIAALRDKSKHWFAKFAYGVASLGWRGSARHWHRYEQCYTILAGVSAPLVLSVHTIVSFDFAVGIVPGWHTTIFPPYFVAGAVFAGFAMVVTFGIPLLNVYPKLRDFITPKHMDWMGKVTLATGLIVFYGYILEMFYGWYSGNTYERALVLNRLFGPYKYFYYALIFCNGLAPQIFWFKGNRRNEARTWILSLIIGLGMWLERFVIIPMSLTRDFLPSSWGYYSPTLMDWMLFIGTMGLFTFLFFAFIKVLPMINIFEMRELLHQIHEYDHRNDSHGSHGGNGHHTASTGTTGGDGHGGHGGAVTPQATPSPEEAQ